MFEMFEDFTVMDWVKIIVGLVIAIPLFWGSIVLMCLIFPA